MADLIEYLRRAVEDGASDIFIVAGGMVSYKRDGRILPVSDTKVFPPETERLIGEIYRMAGREQDRYLKTGDDDFSFAQPGLARFRVNTYRQRGSMAAVIRVVSFEIPDHKVLGIPDSVMEVADVSHGMVVISGTAGSGKSTTQACLIDRINRTRSAHVITLEDPIEFLYRDEKSIISQREIAIDTEDYLSALRSCLRQAPDVILLGEMRDYETIRTAMTAAETGHLVITTLHTQGAVSTIDRIIDIFPPAQQAQVRTQLSMVLHSVISQQLLPGKEGGRVPAVEVMRVNGAIRNMIRDSKNYQIDNVIQTSSAEGMISMDQAIWKLYQEGAIGEETAADYAANPEQMRRRLSQGK
ncbi:PilT/PilU family type 4a pilus ATPase [Oscillibacter sp. MSJ-2]|uniref:PilT/PilU family type 4a pilus ATPase n=1 Tax=Dysosmobacter acutus TaxID=2841504 RepID=A0ABS6F954_9FIRM|nr:PilT/PilU family type 4a pilus ATPase [Dysosmobacter acutus]MBU5626600.1 PilT/PilU family type 4a pilus ATPase [Dysosmobacter acutus]